MLDKFFFWIRDSVRRAVAAGVADAVDELGGLDDLPPALAARLRPALPAPAANGEAAKARRKAGAP